MKKFFYGLGVYTLCAEIYKTIHYGPEIMKEWAKAVRDSKKIINGIVEEQKEIEIKNKRRPVELKAMNKIGF